jgi:isoaspartyl peptidase/L-asparaginase-like protein (Ntn-hydrolase superfamily)
MEDDCRFNAGTGANIRLDGRTIQMDASLMTGDGRYAAVGAVERVKNPILVARAVLDTPHLLLVGEGATRFAHNAGFDDTVPVCPEAERKYERRMLHLREAYGAPEGIEFDWRDVWNFPDPMPEEMKSWGAEGGTVGTVARDREGGFAATLSTGGTSITLYGRVGDVPVFGAGIYAGPEGAVACTGYGEEIIRRALARSIYEGIASGLGAQRAVSEAARAFPGDHSIGLIAVDAEGWGVAANRKMAFGMAGD